MSYTERACAIDFNLQSLLQRHSIKETGADIWLQRFHSVYENTRLRPSTRRRIDGVFKFIHFGERFRIYAFTVSVFVWTEGLNAKTFAFTGVCVYNRLRVDGAWDSRESVRFCRQLHRICVLPLSNRVACVKCLRKVYNSDNIVLISSFLHCSVKLRRVVSAPWFFLYANTCSWKISSKKWLILEWISVWGTAKYFSWFLAGSKWNVITARCFVRLGFQPWHRFFSLRLDLFSLGTKDV